MSFERCKHMCVARLQSPGHFGRNQRVEDVVCLASSPNWLCDVCPKTISCQKNLTVLQPPNQRVDQHFDYSFHPVCCGPRRILMPHVNIGGQYLPDGCDLFDGHHFFAHHKYLWNNLLYRRIVGDHAHIAKSSSSVASGCRINQASRASFHDSCLAC